jgi:hypothetical protein
MQQIQNMPFHDQQVTTTDSMYTENPQPALLCSTHHSIPWSTSKNYTLNIYRKTTTETGMHYTSNHPTQHKHAAFPPMINKEQTYIQDIQENHNILSYATTHLTILHNINTQHSIPWSASNNHMLNVYRITTTGIVMHYTSNHTTQHNHTTFHSMINK